MKHNHNQHNVEGLNWKKKRLESTQVYLSNPGKENMITSYKQIEKNYKV